MAWTERYVRDDAAGGADGTNNTTNASTGAWTLAEAIANYAAGQRINVRAGTYANTTTSRTLATAGTTTAPIWWRGFNTTPGDCDTDFSLTLPEITFTTGAFRITNSYQTVSNLKITASANTTGALHDDGGSTLGIHLDRLDVENTNAHATAYAFLTASSHMAVYSRCRFKATSTASAVCQCTSASSAPRFDFIGNHFEGGGTGLNVSTGEFYRLIANIFNNNGGSAFVDAGAGTVLVMGNAFYSPGTDGCRFSATKTRHVVLANNLFEDCLYGINNTSGTNSALFVRIGNGFYNMTSGNESGFGDHPSISEISLSASPFVNAGAGDFTTAAGNARGGGQPTKFMGLSLTNYLDAGAVQHQGTGGAGGPAMLINGGLVQ
jgi:hypothetical protein